MEDEGSWKTQAFRQSVVSKIEEAMRQAGLNPSRNTLEMENHVFQKAKSKEEYLGYVARLILHVREMSKFTVFNNPNHFVIIIVDTKKGGGMGVPGANQGAPGVPDLVTALRTLEIQNDDSWKNQPFRQEVILDLEEAIHYSCINSFCRTLDLEDHFFETSKSKEEYLGYVARLILHLHELRYAKTGDREVWRDPTFRQNVVLKMQKAFQQSGLSTSHKNLEMEKHFYEKSKSKVEYLGNVDRLILHIRDAKKRGTPINFSYPTHTSAAQRISDSKMYL